jgi:hypothetical protein
MAKKKARKSPARRAAPRAAPMAAPAETMQEQPMTTEPAPVEMPAEKPAEAPASKHHFHLGVWAYFIGLAVAVVAAFVVPGNDFMTFAVLALLGFIVGLLNITDDEVMLFLVASIAFVVSANSVRSILDSSPGVTQVLTNVIMFTAASAFIVSIKAIIKTAKNE